MEIKKTQVMVMPCLLWLFACQSFGQPVQNIVDSQFQPATDGTVADVAVQADGKILIAGSFSHVYDNAGNAFPCHNLARLSADGNLDSTDSSFNSTAAPVVAANPGSVYSVAVDALHRVYVGGDGGLTRLDASGNLDVLDFAGQPFTFSTDGGVYAFSGGGKDAPYNQSICSSR